jgi:hypothetical protein
MPRSFPKLMLALLTAPATLAQNASPQALNEARAACETDVQNLCAGVPAGGGRIIACLKQHQNDVSSGCKSAIANAMQGANGGGSAAALSPTNAGASASPTNPPAPASPGKPAASSATSVPAPTSAALATKSGGGSGGDRYFVMKQVTMNDASFQQGQGGAAYTLMVPTTWQFKGWVNTNAADTDASPTGSPPPVKAKAPMAPSTCNSSRNIPFSMWTILPRNSTFSSKINWPPEPV